MRPKIYQVKKVNQGSGNPESAWAKARFCFMKQLAIRFGQLDPTKIEDPTDQESNLDAQQSISQYFLVGGGGGCRVHPYVQQGDVKPAREVLIPLQKNSFCFCFVSYSL